MEIKHMQKNNENEWLLISFPILSFAKYLKKMESNLNKSSNFELFFRSLASSRRTLVHRSFLREKFLIDPNF